MREQNLITLFFLSVDGFNYSFLKIYFIYIYIGNWNFFFLFEIIILRLYQLIIKSVFRFNVVRSKKKKITQRNSKRFQYKDNNTLIRLYDNLYLRCLREYKLFQTYFEHSFYTHLRINFFFFLFKRSRRNFVPHVIHDIFLISTFGYSNNIFVI